MYDNATDGNEWFDIVGLDPNVIASTYTVSTRVVEGQYYGFRVRARNIFGWGPNSTVTTVHAAREPDQPEAPTTSIDADTGGMTISWTAPPARGSAIDRYRIEILVAGSNPEQWLETDDCDGSLTQIKTDRKCVVPMTTLTDVATFGYDFDEVVKVRVTAKNFYGFGVPSAASAASGARIRSIPAQMAKPVEDEATSTDVQIRLTWAAVSGVAAGNSDTLGYSLRWDNADATKTVEQFTEVIHTQATSYIVPAVEGGKTYRFTINARNIYGSGPQSEVTIVVPDDKPGVIAMPTVALYADDLTMVNVKWEAPDAHHSPITAYSVLFQKNDGSFVASPHCDGATNATILSGL